MPAGNPADQLTAFELKLIDLLCAQATPQERARRGRSKTWDLVHARPDDDAVKRRVVEVQALARLSARGSASDGHRRPVPYPADTRIAVRVRSCPSCSTSTSRRARSPTCSSRGAGLGVLALVFTSQLIQDRELVILAEVATALSVVMYVSADRITTWQLHAFLASGTVILTLANYFVEATLHTRSSTRGRRCTPSTSSGFARRARPRGADRGGLRDRYDPGRAGQRGRTPATAGRGHAADRRPADLAAAHAPAGGGLSAEEALSGGSAQRARTRLVLDSAPDAFAAIDRDGLVNSWNAASERLFGWSASEAIGKPLRSLIFPSTSARPTTSGAGSPSKRPRPWSHARQSELQRRDGSVFPASGRSRACASAPRS